MVPYAKRARDGGPTPEGRDSVTVTHGYWCTDGALLGKSNWCREQTL